MICVLSKEIKNLESQLDEVDSKRDELDMQYAKQDEAYEQAVDELRECIPCSHPVAQEYFHDNHPFKGWDRHVPTMPPTDHSPVLQYPVGGDAATCHALPPA